MQRDRRVPRKRRRGYTKGPHIYPRGGVWWAYLGPGDRVTLDTTDETEAGKRLADKIRERARAPRGRPGEKSLAMIAKEYTTAPHGWTRRTERTTKLRVASFVEAMEARGITHPSLISDAALDHWRKARMDSATRTTINRDEIVARKMLRWAKGRNLCDDTPLETRKLLREPRRKPPPIIPSPREIASVIAAMESLDEHGAALTLATTLATGQRIDELRHVDTWNVAGTTMCVTPEKGPAADAWMSKGFAERRIPLSENAARVVREFGDWLRNGIGGKGKPIGLSDTWIADKIDDARALVKPHAVPKFRMHDVRRTFATECVRSGVPITVVREWLGHRDVATTERYIGRYRDDVDVVVPTPAALDVLGKLPANVVSLKGRN